MYQELEDKDLLVASRKDPDAFGVFYERHAKDLLRHFARRTLDPEAAADLTAETFSRAFLARTRYRPMRSPAEAWLYGIARRELSTFHRKGTVERRARDRLGLVETEVGPDDYERIEELIDFERVGRAIAKALSLLSEDQREAMTLRVIEGRSYTEVATMLSCSEDTARARVSRGLRRLAGILETSPELQIGR